MHSSHALSCAEIKAEAVPALIPGAACSLDVHHLTDLELRQLHASVEAELQMRAGFPVLPRHKPCPARAFSVPDGITYLNTREMDALAEAFRQWRDAARTPLQRRSRSRMLAVYLILRHTGMKLGEVLAMDDRRDLDPARSAILVHGSREREAPLPKAVAEELDRLFDDPLMAGLRGEILRLDQGYVRKQFLAMAAASGLPRGSLNPQTIRHSRAVELLRSGLPLPLVQSVLGHKDITLTAQYVAFNDRAAATLIDQTIKSASVMKTSARNAFPGTVSAIRSGSLLTEVELTTDSGLRIVSVITNESARHLDIEPGKYMAALVKAPWVVLLRQEEQPRTSARNVFCGTISAVQVGEIAAEVAVTLADGTVVTSLVTDESVNALDLKVGQPICALIKAFSVILSLEVPV
ncbi:TOBE domain-containing protein [Megalodesulfovibrio gigas]|nr:TOBE domain-containing protein [Megalodesulfovibrio gigas]